MTSGVLFDLGNTLAAYYHVSEFRPILANAIGAVRDELGRRLICDMSFDAAFDAAINENREALDHRFTPMIERFERIFRARLANDPALSATLCEMFLAPIFAVGRVYDDTLPALERLREAGLRTAIVSNTPWGSPAELWRNELRRLTLSDAVDAVVLCGDVGWRKPAPHIFQHAMTKLRCQPADCIFVGDDLRWDIEGSASVGIHSILLDRDGRHPEYAGERFTNLRDLVAVIAAGA